MSAPAAGVRRGAEALLARLVDYAGLFPPAQLDMASTAANYARHAQGDEAWMLGRLIVPVSRLLEFEDAAAGILPTSPDDEPWHLGGLLAPAGDLKIVQQLEMIESFNAAHAAPQRGLARVDVVELPAADPRTIERALDAIPDEIFPFFELPLGGDVRGLLAALVGSDAGAKARTGGIRPELYPRTVDLARFIEACVGAGVPFKATAGLHHPLRHRNDAVPADEFGFLGVFGGAALLDHGAIGADDLPEVLEESRRDAFTIDDDGLAWRDRRVPAEEIERTRDRLAVSFGSCSFEEPVSDLRALGVL